MEMDENEAGMNWTEAKMDENEAKLATAGMPESDERPTPRCFSRCNARSNESAAVSSSLPLIYIGGWRRII